MRINIEEDARELTAKTLGTLIDAGMPQMIIKYYMLQKKVGSEWATVQVYPNMQELDVDVDGVNYKWVQKTETYPLSSNTYPVVYYRGRYSVFTSEELTNYIEDYFSELGDGVTREYLAHRYHYDPLANYDRHEHYNEKTTDAFGHVITTTYNSTDTNTKNLTDTNTKDLTDTNTKNLTDTITKDLTDTNTKNLTNTNNTNLTAEINNGLMQTSVDSGSEKDDAKEYVTGYNAPSSETLNSHTEHVKTFTNRTNTTTNSGKDTTTQTGTDTTTQTGTDTNKHTGTDTTTQTGTDTNKHTGTDTTTQTGTDTNAKTGTDADAHSGSDTETRVTDNHLIGNIGTTMTQDMIEREMTLGARNVLQEIFYNCIKDVSFIA